MGLGGQALLLALPGGEKGPLVGKAKSPVEELQAGILKLGPMSF